MPPAEPADGQDGPLPHGPMVVCASHSPLIDTHPTSGAAFRSGVEAVAGAVRRFAPELVVFFGSDHRRAFTDVRPAFTVVTSATGRGDWGTPTGSYDVPTTVAYRLAEHLLDAGVDVAVAENVELDHGFSQTTAQLFGSLSAVPIIPVVINCAVPPLPPMARVVRLAQVVADFLSSTRRRVLCVGSGGLSHSPPSLGPEVVGLPEGQRRAMVERGLRDAAGRIDPAWDGRFLRLIEQADPTVLAALDDDEVGAAGVGAHEIRAWVAAVTAGGTAMSTLVYEPVPDWITGMGLAVSRG